jgi:hypothetical protein
LLERPKELFEGVLVAAVRAIKGLSAPGRDHAEKAFPLERGAIRTVSESPSQNLILPKLQKGGGAVPVERKKKDESVVFAQEGLFLRDIDPIVRV